MSFDPLTVVQARVLFVLVEKERTVPDTYPLTLNALVAGCNQKTSRDPVLSLTESDAQAAIDALRRRSLIIESSGGRVMRYSHNVGRVLNVPTQSVALLTVMALRGPQTVGELRINCDRLHRFLDLSSVQGFLDELASRDAGALVRELPRQAGARETRWAHLLCGEPQLPAGFVAASWVASADDAGAQTSGRSADAGALAVGPGADGAATRIDELSAQVIGLTTRLHGLEQEVEFLKLQIAELTARS